MAGKRVFICAAPEDDGHREVIIAALDAWQAPHSELGVVPDGISSLPPAVERTIRDCQVFLRLCTTNTRGSGAVNLATQSFLQLLRADRQRGRRQRRRLVNLILDPSYPLDDEERKTLYITTEGKARALWLEELAAPVGVATLAQQVSRRAVLGMGVGATLTLASAGAAGVLLYQQRQPPPLPVRFKISGNPRYVFQLSESTASSVTADYAVVLQDGATVYAQPTLVPTDTQPQADSSVFVLSSTDGKQRRLPIVTHSVEQGALVAGARGTLYLYFERSLEGGTPNPSEVRAIGARDGKPLWSLACDYAAVPAVADGILYCVLALETSRNAEGVTYQNSVNALRQADGTTLWQSTDFDLIDPGYHPTTPAVAGGRLYIGSPDHRVYCLDATTGHTRWSYLTRGPVLCSPIVAGGLVYVGSEDGQIYALDAESGRLHWRFATTDGVVATPLVLDGVAYVGSRDSYVYALDARTGAMFWRAYLGVNPRTDNAEAHEVQNAPVIYRNVLFATVYGGLYAFDIRDGTPRWRYIPYKEDFNAISPPLISDGLVLFGAADNAVYAVNP
jgi:outer membrane protein assembly factor BamB